MSNQTDKQDPIERFGREIARLHERSVAAVERKLEKIANPKSDHDRALSSYYSQMDQNQFIISLVSGALESVLHDLFFLFDEQKEFKILLENDQGEMVDLATAADVIQVLPLDWIEKYSATGLEAGRRHAFLNQTLKLDETRQERRTRVLAEKQKTMPRPDND